MYYSEADLVLGDVIVTRGDNHQSVVRDFVSAVTHYTEVDVLRLSRLAGRHDDQVQATRVGGERTVGVLGLLGNQGGIQVSVSFLSEQHSWSERHR